MNKEALTDNVLNNEESSFNLLNINYAILSEETVPNPGLKVTAGQNQHEFQIKPGGFYFSKLLFEGLIITRRGLSTEENLGFKIDWASLIVGSKVTALLCLTMYLRTIFQVQAPEGLIFGGAI